MRISKSAPNLLKKAATSVKSKSDALRTKLVFVASVRRKLAMVCAMSRQIHALGKLNGQEKQAKVEHGSKALTVHKAMATIKEAASDHGGKAHLGMFEEDGHGDDHAELDDLDALNDDEPSVIEIIKSNREAQGLEFNMDDEIDEACDMFIRKCRSQMNLSLMM
ncbi:unnamed protein product [Urochloa humidicola]